MKKKKEQKNKKKKNKRKKRTKSTQRKETKEDTKWLLVQFFDLLSPNILYFQSDQIHHFMYTWGQLFKINDIVS